MFPIPIPTKRTEGNRQGSLLLRLMCKLKMFVLSSKKKQKTNTVVVFCM